MLQKSTAAACVAIACIVITGIAWQKIPHPIQTTTNLQDTIPAKEKKHSQQTVIRGDLDKAMEEVKKAQENLDLQLQKGNLDNMQKELQKAQSALNTENIHLQLANAMKEIDIQKINMEAQLKNIDIQKIQAQTQAALQKINWEKMQKELLKAQGELRNSIDQEKLESDIRMSMEETKKVMAELKAVDMEKIRQALDNSKEELKRNEGKIQEELERARTGMSEHLRVDLKKELEKTKEQLLEYKNMLDEMNKEGLLTSKEEYNIEYKSGDLYINGTQQPENITRKYKHNFKEKHVKLSRSKDDDKRVIDL